MVDLGKPDERAARYEAGWRLGRAPFVLLWTLGTLLLYLVLPPALILGLGLEGPARAVALVAVFVVISIARVVLATARLRDLGRPPSQVLWGLIPVGDVVLLFMLGQRTPSDEVRRKRVRSWITQTDALDAWGRGLALAGRTAVTGLAAALLAALLQGGLGEVFRDAVVARAVPGGSEGLVQALIPIVGLLALYTALQASKAGRVTRASWLPSLLLLPLAALLGALMFAPASGQGAGAVLLMLVEIAWMLGAGSLAGGLAAAVWIVAGVRAHEGRSTSVGDVLADAARHAADVVVAWGTRNQIVQVGIQVVVPGVWYAISFAFSDLVVVVHPERPMLGGSTELTRGIRSKIFTMLAIGFVLQLIVMAAVSIGFLGPELAFGALFDPSLVPLPAVLLGDFLGWCVTWLTTMALLVVFFERDALLAAKRSREAGARDAGGPAPTPLS